jgi:O-antigen/teichoic acid export membrane protein
MKRFSTTVLRNSAFGIAAQLAIKVLSFIFNLLIVRKFGPEVYGQYSAVLAFGAVFAIFGDLGLGLYTVRAVARWHDDPAGRGQAEKLYGNVLTLRLLLSLATAFALIATAWFTQRPLIMIGAIALSTLGLMFYAVQGTSDAMLAGYERLDLSSGARVLNQLLFVGLGAVVLVAGIGYYGLIVANLLGVAAMAYVCWRGVSRLGLRPGRPNWREWWLLLRASLPFAIIGFALGLSYKFDSVLLNLFRNDQEVGYYNAVYNLVFSAAMLSNAFNTALYPSLTRQATSQPESLPRIYERSLRYLMVLALPIAAGVWAVADQLVPFLQGPAYAPAIPALKIIVWVVPLMFTSEFLGYVVLIAGKERYVARSVVISTICNVIANLFLVPVFGFIGAAVMTVATEAVLVGQYVWLLRDLLRRLNWGQMLVRPLLAAGLMVAALLIVPDLHVLIRIGLGALIYGSLLIALRVLGKDEVRFVRGLRGTHAEAVPER